MSLASPLIKVCGITRVEDAQYAASLGAWAVGMVFVPSSPRVIDAETARLITESVKVEKVGVFVNASIEKINQTVQTVGLTAVQLHGDEDLSFISLLKKSIPQIKIIKALRPQTREDLKVISEFRSVCDWILMDAYSPKERGGTGQVADWTLAHEASQSGPILLAGGLNTENVQAACAQVHPHGLDVSSGLEISPGVKSKEKMALFFNNIVFKNTETIRS